MREIFFSKKNLTGVNLDHALRHDSRTSYYLKDRIWNWMATQKHKETNQFIELIIVVIAIVIPFLLKPEYVWVYEVITLSYLFIERKIRRRSWKDIGVRTQGIIVDIKSNFPIIFLVSFCVQFAVIVGSYMIFSPLFLRLDERVAYLQTHFGSFAPAAFFLWFIALATLIEELVFRGLIQERVSWFLNDYAGIIIGSLVLSVIHYSQGETIAVFLDLCFVFFDSVFYGLIYMRSRNVLVSWTAHLSADLIGLYLLWSL